MATLSTKLTITSSNAKTDALNITFTDTLTVTDPVETGKIPITIAVGGGTLGTLVPSSDSNTYYVYLKNLDATNFVSVQDDAAATFQVLYPEEFTWFSLAPGEGLELRANTDTVRVEYGLFKKG